MGNRLFTAVALPEVVVSRLEAQIGPRRDIEDRLRWVPAHRWHITTCFAPEVEANSLDRFRDNLWELAARTTVIRLVLGGALAFPNPGLARVLTMPVGDPDGGLVSLAAATRRAAARSGIRVDGAKYRPHLTLARVKQPFNASKWLEVIGAFIPERFTVSEFLLVQSHGPRFIHEVLERFPLQSDRLAE